MYISVFNDEMMRRFFEIFGFTYGCLASIYAAAVYVRALRGEVKIPNSPKLDSGLVSFASYDLESSGRYAPTRGSLATPAARYSLPHVIEQTRCERRCCFSTWPYYRGDSTSIDWDAINTERNYCSIGEYDLGTNFVFRRSLGTASGECLVRELAKTMVGA